MKRLAYSSLLGRSNDGSVLHGHDTDMHDQAFEDAAMISVGAYCICIVPARAIFALRLAGLRDGTSHMLESVIIRP